MNLVVRGRGSYEVDGKRHPLVPGTVLWIRPGEEHYVEERSEDFFMWIVAAEKPLFAATPTPELISSLFPAGAKSGLSRVLAADDTNWLERELRRIFERGSPDFLRAGVSYAMLGAWESTVSASETTPGVVLSAPLAKAIELLEADPASSRENLADHVGTTPERLGRLFRTELQVSFIDYRNRLRLQKYLEIRRLGRGTLLGACLEAGFGSYAQFHRVFTDAMGVSPSNGADLLREHGTVTAA
jgi:AraC-like DNA-binding protein